MLRTLFVLLFALPALAQQPTPQETVLPFINFPGCDTQLHLRGAIQDITVEALQRGNSLGSFTLYNLQRQTFWLSSRIPAVAGEFGTLKLTGQVTVLGQYFCNGSLYSFREGVQIPMNSTEGKPPIRTAENYEVLEVAGRHLSSHSFWGHTYSYRVTIRNPTDKTYTYVLTLIFRDPDGFAVATAPIVQTKPPFGPGDTQTFEGTIGGFGSSSIHFHHDPADITLDVTVEPNWLSF